VESLGGAPGVHTARYAGPSRNATDNMDLVLHNLKDNHNRNARFRTCIALILDGKEMLFEGKVEGQISLEKQGEGGFGYDPIFIPNGYNKSFAQLDASIKNQISHRKRALDELIVFLNKYKP
jgi:XTP/dITP diphosphohydrolase